MATIRYGDRIGREAKLRLGTSATIFDETRTKILITRRTDNGRWCLPGGGMDPGESVEEACAREVWEETGLVVRIGQLLGVYSNPHRLIEYADGNKWQFVSLNFIAEVTGGTLGLSDETTEVGYFTWDEIQQMDFMEHQLERIRDALQFAPIPFVR